MKKVPFRRAAVEGFLLGVGVNLAIVFPIMGGGWVTSLIGGAVTFAWIVWRTM